jgi:hypothetical protein
MNLWPIFLCLFLVACSHGRKISSVDDPYVMGKVSRKLSQVSLYPPEKVGDLFRYYFFVQIKNAQNNHIDCDTDALKLKSVDGKDLPYTLDRILHGRYYLILEQTENNYQKQVNVELEGKLLKEKFYLSMGTPDPNYSSLKITERGDHEITLELKLKDSKNKALDAHVVPEIVLDGLGSVEEVKYVKAGIWHVRVTYPEHNQIIYFSVRASGTKLERMLRFQHIDK